MRRPVVLAAVVLSLAVVPVRADADAPAQQGWWTTANPGGSSALPAPAAPGGPDVPADGLLVEAAGSSSAPTAFAALTYDTPLPAGTAATLDLAVTANSATTPGATLELCPLTGSTIQPEQGAPMSDAPRYDCTRHVTATVSSTGSSFHFHLGPLLEGAPLALAILPTANVERVVLDRPGASSLSVPQNPSSTTPTSGDSVIPASPPASSDTGTPRSAIAGSAVGATASAPAVGLATTGASGPDVSAQSPALATPAAAATTSTTSQGGPAGRAVASPVAVRSAAKSGSSFPFPALLLIAGLVAVVGLWSYAGRAAVANQPGQNPTG